MTQDAHGLFRSCTGAVAHYTKATYRRFQEEDILILSSGLAFNGLLCMIPLLLLLTSFLGVFLNSSELAVKRIDEILTAAFPPEPYALKIKSSIQDIVAHIIHFRRSFGLIGLATLTWTAASLFTASRTVLNKMYRLASGRMAIVGMLKDLLFVILAGGLFILSNIVPWLIAAAGSAFTKFPGLNSRFLNWSVQSLPSGLGMLLTFVMFLILYRFIPEKGITVRTAAVSALTTTILWVAMGRAFRWYLLTFGAFGQLYGTYAFILVILVWAYYSSIIFIFGAMVGQVSRERKLGIPGA